MASAGKILGDYLLIRKLAQGGMGEIFLACDKEQEEPDKLLVLKVLRSQLAADQSFVEMLTDEANVVRKLSHKNIVSFHDFGECDSTYFIALEYIHGGSLENLLEVHLRQSQKIDLAISMYIICELCAALSYAHDSTDEQGQPLNLIHRDVTPSNLLLSKDGDVKLTDFGLVRAKGRMTQTMPGILKGSFGYMAPEVMKYEDIDHRADIFAAGVLLYEILAGVGPLMNNSVANYVNIIEQKSYPKPSELNPHVPPQLDEIVLKALNPDPSGRWQSAGEMKAEVEQLIGDWKKTWPEADSGRQRLSQLIPILVKEAAKPAVTSAELSELRREISARAMLSEGTIDASDSAWREPTENDETLVRAISSPALMNALSEMVAEPQLLTPSLASLAVNSSDDVFDEGETLSGKDDDETLSQEIVDTSTGGTQPVLNLTAPVSIVPNARARRHSAQSGIAETFESLRPVDEVSLVANEAMQQKQHLAALRDELSLKEAPKVPGWDIAFTAQFFPSRGGDLVTKVNRPNGLFGLGFLQIIDGEPPPGLFTVRAASIFEACMAQSVSLSSGLAWSNRLLSRSSKRRESVSACYFQFDESAEVLHYINAGYPPPFYYKASDAQLFSLAGTNSGLGTNGNGQFEQRKVPVASNDIILIVTTGLLEAKNTSKDLFGWHRAQETLLSGVEASAQGICDQLTSAVERHVTGSMPSRDWAIVVLKKQ